MENSGFARTQVLLRANCQVLAKKLSKVMVHIKDFDYSSSSTNSWTGKRHAEHIYLVNKYIIEKVEHQIQLLHEGLVNEENEYLESDLKIVETMIHVSVFKMKSLPEFNTPLFFSPQELELKLAVQNLKLIQLIKEAPAFYANNYLSNMKILSGIKLDVYQLIYFAIKHMDHHLNQVLTIEEIKLALNLNSINMLKKV